jgi:hypothetical protein
MYGPGIGAWIKKAAEAPIGQDRADIRAFLPIADNARQRQILRVGASSVFETNYVVDLKGEKAITLVVKAIFAYTIRPGPHEEPQFIANETAHGATADEPAPLPAA